MVEQEQNSSAPAKKMPDWIGEDSDYDDEEEVEFGQENKPKQQARPAAKNARGQDDNQSNDIAKSDTPHLEHA